MKGMRGMFRGGGKKDQPNSNRLVDDDEEDEEDNDEGLQLPVSLQQNANARTATHHSRETASADAPADDDSMFDESVGTGLHRPQRAAVSVADSAARPSYRIYNEDDNEDTETNAMDQEDDDEDEGSYDDGAEYDETGKARRHIATSAGTSRLNRILERHDAVNDNDEDDLDPARRFLLENTTTTATSTLTSSASGPERVTDPTNIHQVGAYCARRVIPPLRVDRSSIGGHLVAEQGYPVSTMQQETLVCVPVHSFEWTSSTSSSSTTVTTESVAMSALQFPGEYKNHKRSLGLYAGGGGGGTGRGRQRLRYVLLARSTNQPTTKKAVLNNATANASQQQQQQKTKHDDGGAGDYDAMFAPDKMGDDDDDLSVPPTGAESTNSERQQQEDNNAINNETTVKATDLTGQHDDTTAPAQQDLVQLKKEDEISSFPVLICMTMHTQGTAPDIRKLIPLEQLTTVQDLNSTVVQLAFRNGDTVRLEFGTETAGSSKQKQHHYNPKDELSQEGSLDKERFIWSLFQVHAMLCVAVVERHALFTSTNETAQQHHQNRTYLPPLSVRNLDRAELQYVATVNHFLPQSPALQVLLGRHQQTVERESARLGTVLEEEGNATSGSEEEKVELEPVDRVAYDLMMGNFSTRITLFRTEEERQDVQDILNSMDLLPTSSKKEGSNSTTENTMASSSSSSIAERLAFQLQLRMRDLEAETCRRLITWEDEKMHNAASSSTPRTHSSPLDDTTKERDSVDALALASLFSTLESLDGELLQMESWLQERAAAIKPLTDDCADIEEENRQLEQQWKSYDLLGSEIRRLLNGLELDEEMERVLRNPAQALVYDGEGLVDIDASENGVEQIYDAGKALQEAIEYPRKSGGLHLRPVHERAKGLTKLCNGFCKALAQIIVTVMEQFKTEVVAGSDNGKVSKSDTHSIIARKIRDTQRKFQSALLGYLKLIEVLAALSPEMLPALRDAYSEMVAEGILMKKRMKGYFQALPGKNAAYLAKVGKDLKEYEPLSDGTNSQMDSVNAADMKAAMSELFPVIAREAYFTSALFGSSNKNQDGREKKRNFENAKTAVDHSSQHFRYYINRTCGIMEGPDGKPEGRSDHMLCLVASIYLNEVMDNYVDREKKGGDHSLSLAYVRATILDLRKRADKLWVQWVEKQIDWIRSSDGVPLHGKRAGVFPSFVRFPLYLDHVLFCCREGRAQGYTPNMSRIKVINYYMQKMASALLDSLRDCATRESTDKQYASTVMQMENTYHFTQSVKERGSVMEEIFSKQVTKANAICKESTDAYLGWMIKREFASLHELFSRVSKMRKDVGDTEVAKNIPKQVFVRTLSKEASREVLKERITNMYSRMEKHLEEGGKLLPVAWKALVKVLYEWFGRWEKMSAAIYRHKLEPTPVDVVRIAKAAGGAGKTKQQNTGGGDFAFKNILALGKEHQKE